MAEIISIANQKGGVSKTTLTHNLACALALKKKKVLMVDLDMQASLTFVAGIEDPIAFDGHNIINVLEAEMRRMRRGNIVRVKDCIHPVGASEELKGYLYIIPSIIDLAQTEQSMIAWGAKRDFFLQRALKSVQDDFDYILIDCPPSLGELTLNALVASDGVLIPCKTDFLSYRGLGQLTDTILDVQETLNPDLKIYGVIATLFQSRVKTDNQVLHKLQKHDKYLLTIKQAAVARQGVLDGISFVEFKPNHEISIAVTQIADMIISGELRNE